ncbi:MAG TPA: elongation factor P maturation arginine rhamnosyltransferase EarP [Herbaspirillum sp.]|nr:elongation factor P maturation arginine rhamnosyltransferase EarP [Herbaspirillum sp.]
MHPTRSSATAAKPAALALFCKVVDNYGDIGICWRLSRQLQREYGIAVTLWVDDLDRFQRICPEGASDRQTQEIQGIMIRHWRDQEGRFDAAEIPDVVIEFFGCAIPPDYIEAMSRCMPRPVWLNLEGLSAESWVESCHTLPSPHTRLPLTKYFFFPGFTPRTGGLQHEAGLDVQRSVFQKDPAAMRDFLSRFGVTTDEMAALKVSLFCYPQAPIQDLLDTWRHADKPVLCLVPEGVAAAAISAFLGQTASAGANATHGALTVRVLPFMPQPDYDKLLWACDLNFVRGEDSFVRAQWACKPFIWHIYSQDENLHHIKLKAFLGNYGAATGSLVALTLAWNGVTQNAVKTLWPAFAADMPDITRLSMDWQARLLANGDLVSNLLQFAQTVQQSARENGPNMG